MRTNTVAVVPVYNPEPGLLGLCASLVAHFATVLVVDDGSDEYVDDFSRLPADVTLVRHAGNCGKGRAIKTAFAWVAANCPEAIGVVFADGDGQHRVEDIVRVAERMAETGAVTLGVRDFSRSTTPFRSRFGNALTSFLVRHLFRIRIYDTQTGLRAIPARLWSAMQAVPGERYEYEMRIFGLLRDRRERLELVSIETIYVANNRASHFRPFTDSLRVYRGLFGMTIARFLRFALSSLMGFAVDNVVFTVALVALESTPLRRSSGILASLVVARVVSATANYLCNRWLVFRSRAGWAFSSSRYVSLVVVIAALSYGGTASLSALCDAHGLLVTCLKIVVETVLFVLSYKIQAKWVFASAGGTGL